MQKNVFRERSLGARQQRVWVENHLGEGKPKEGT